jgi:hypothetical protein
MLHLPIPDVPHYRPGAYGDWQLVELPASRQYGYFTAPRHEESYYGLVRDGQTWMSTSRMERESHAFHVSVARGRVMVCGVGMGMILYNLCRLDRVSQVLAVDIDPNVIAFLQQATDFGAWPGRDKIRFLCCDARQLSAEAGGPDPLDHLYVDIWPDLGTAEAVIETRQIQSVVCAKRVGYWGQEIDFGHWHTKRRGGRRPHALEGNDFARYCRLPLGQLPQPYLEAACLARQLLVKKVLEDEAAAKRDQASR